MVMAPLPVVIPLEVTAVDHQHSRAHGGQPMTWQGRYHCGRILGKCYREGIAAAYIQ